MSEVQSKVIDLDEQHSVNHFFKAAAVILAFWFIWGALDHAVDKICDTYIEVNKSTNTREADLKLMRLDIIEQNCRAQHQLDLYQPRIYQYPQPIQRPVIVPGPVTYTPADPPPVPPPHVTPGPVDEEADEQPTVAAPDIKTFDEPDQEQPVPAKPNQKPSEELKSRLKTWRGPST